MITQIEQALVNRLSRGLGKLAYRVDSYHGELDDAAIDVRRLPAVLVTYGGSRIERAGVTAKGHRHKSTDTFVAIVMVRSLRSNQAARQGGVAKFEVGANQLVYAVLRLLTNQTLDNLVEPIKPIAVRTLFNYVELQKERLTAYAVEFEVCYSIQPPLEDGEYPAPTDDPTHPDYLFNAYNGELTPPHYLERITGVITDPEATTGFDIKTETKNESKS